MSTKKLTHNLLWVLTLLTVLVLVWLKPELVWELGKEPRDSNGGSLSSVSQTYSQETQYNREKHFGTSWKDVDGNGCDTRNDILKRDLNGVVLAPMGKGAVSCPNATVLAGVLSDPYSGKDIYFHRGGGKNKDGGVQIDHVVALKDSWKRGSYKWSQEKREKFANDPDNLIASDGPLNMEKGDKTTGEWLPPNKAFRCEYVKRYNWVLRKYGLEVSEKDLNVEKRECSGN